MNLLHNGNDKALQEVSSENIEVKKYLFLLAAYTIPLPFPQIVLVQLDIHMQTKKFYLNFTPYTEIN